MEKGVERSLGQYVADKRGGNEQTSTELRLSAKPGFGFSSVRLNVETLDVDIEQRQLQQLLQYIVHSSNF